MARRAGVKARAGCRGRARSHRGAASALVGRQGMRAQGTGRGGVHGAGRLGAERRAGPRVLDFGGGGGLQFQSAILEEAVGTVWLGRS